MPSMFFSPCRQQFSPLAHWVRQNTLVCCHCFQYSTVLWALNIMFNVYWRRRSPREAKKTHLQDRQKISIKMCFCAACTCRQHNFIRINSFNCMCDGAIPDTPGIYAGPRPRPDELWEPFPSEWWGTVGQSKQNLVKLFSPFLRRDSLFWLDALAWLGTTLDFLLPILVPCGQCGDPRAERCDAWYRC